MPDFLLVHDAGHGAWAWAYVRAALEDVLRRQTPLNHPLYGGGTVLVPDLPYHGPRAGQGDPRECTFDAAVEELLAAVERAQLRSPTVVAHGLSGLLALEVARRAKAKPRRLVLVGASVPSLVNTVTEMLPLQVRALLAAHVLRPRTEPGTVRLHPAVVRRFWCRGMEEPVAAAQVVGKLGPIPLKQLDALPHPEALKAPCPVTYVALKRDGLLPFTAQVRMAASLGAELVELDAGHEAPLSHPEALVDVLLGRPVAAATGTQTALAPGTRSA